jgi:hypothetical protein
MVFLLKYLSIYHGSVWEIDEDKVIKILRYCFWISSPILETIDMVWLTDSTKTLPSISFTNDWLPGAFVLGVFIDICLLIMLICLIGGHLHFEYTRSQWLGMPS